VVIVDNDSDNRDFIKDLCTDVNNCDFIEVGFNSGIAHALRVGIEYAKKYRPDWFLFLDDDTILLKNALNIVLKVTSSLLNITRNKVGAVLLSSVDGNCSLKEVKYGVFSGTLIKAEVASRTCCRDDFFLDQADFDMYSRIRDLGYSTLTISYRLIDRRLGLRRWSRILRKAIIYEPPWRYYYIVRNSTKLLIEGKMDFIFYLRQLIDWGVKILLVDGLTAFIKPFGLGLIHALISKLGYLDRRIFNQHEVGEFHGYTP